MWGYAPEELAELRKAQAARLESRSEALRTPFWHSVLAAVPSLCSIDSACVVPSLKQSVMDPGVASIAIVVIHVVVSSAVAALSRLFIVFCVQMQMPVPVLRKF